jgi:methyl-accepting chemotaxis protein
LDFRCVACDHYIFFKPNPPHVKLKNLKIGQKLLLYILVATGIVFITSIGYISIKERQRALRDATALIDNSASNFAEDISNLLNQKLVAVRSLAQAFDIHQSLAVEEWMPLVVGMHRQVFEHNPDFHALWDSWEYKHINPEWELPYGRMLNYHVRKGGNILYEQLERSMDGDPPLYGAAKAAGREMIWEPYPDQLEVDASGSTLMTTLTVPMFVDNNYIGLVGVDITLEHLQNIVAGIKPFDDAYAFLISNKGLFAAHPNTMLLEASVSEYITEDEEKYSITEKISKGETFSFSSSAENGTRYYYTFAPVYVGITQTPWSIGIAVPLAKIQQEASMNFYISLLIGMMGLGVIALVVWFRARKISVPVNHFTNLMKKLARGEIDKSMIIDIQTRDELQEMAEAFNISIKGLDEKTKFALSIGNGNLDTDLHLLSEHDVLGKSLQDMQHNLKMTKDEEIVRQKEDQVRRWSTEGYARFSEILRQNNDNIDKLSFDIIKNLVKYLDANQGGIFILNDEDRNDVFLELKGCYAYDRRKYIEKRIEIGEGLVGTCFKEGKTVYITKIPESYISITSGLGDESPGALVIVPLVLNEVAFGVIEIASFHKFQPYQIEFMEKIGESVASTISSVNISMRTALLLEKSQQQAEEMKAQEEEMRQNMEELHATQEEMARKGSETDGILNALDAASFVIEYDVNGKIINISDSYLKLLSISRQEVIGTHHADNVEFDSIQLAEYESFWQDLRSGRIRTQEVKINVHGSTYWLAETYAPIFDQKGNVLKIFKIAINITESKSTAEKLVDENALLKQKLIELKP